MPLADDVPAEQTLEMRTARCHFDHWQIRHNEERIPERNDQIDQVLIMMRRAGDSMHSSYSDRNQPRVGSNRWRYSGTGRGASCCPASVSSSADAGLLAHSRIAQGVSIPRGTMRDSDTVSHDLLMATEDTKAHLLRDRPRRFSPSANSLIPSLLRTLANGNSIRPSTIRSRRCAPPGNFLPSSVRKETL